MNGVAASNFTGIIHETGPSCGENRCHPAAVIDPQSAEDVERLAGLYDRAVILRFGDPDPRTVTPSQRATALADALLEFATPTPPRPPIVFLDDTPVVLQAADRREPLVIGGRLYTTDADR